MAVQTGTFIREWVGMASLIRRHHREFKILGKIDASNLGRTLTHEHLLLDYRKFFVPGPPDLDKFLDGEITLKNVGFVQRYPYSNKSNISFFSEDTKKAVLYDVEVFKSFGGGTIVENTTHGLNRDIQFLKKVSERTGVHVVAGTGYYLAPAQNENDLNKPLEEIYGLMKEELINGCLDNPGIKCGFMGEIASNYPIHSFEKKVIQASGQVQEELNCPVSFHPGRDDRAPCEIMRIYTEAGGDSRKAVVSHLERTLTDLSQFLDLASEYKCYLQLDLFGTEVLTYQFHPETQMPSDAQRISIIKKLIENGYQSRVLVSHDIHTKHRLIEYGGHGYCHLLKNIIPKMLFENISQALVDQITIDNPKNWLAW